MDAPGFRKAHRLAMLLAAAAVLGVGSGPVCADPEVSTPRLARYDVDLQRQDFATMHSLAGDRASVSEVSSRWWTSRGPADIGVGLGAIAYSVSPLAPGLGFSPLEGTPSASVPGRFGVSGALPNSRVIASTPTLTLGMRYRTSDESVVYADASGARSIGANGVDAYSGKLGVEWKAAQSRFNLAYGGLGMRLTSDSKMTLRMRKGGVGLFMRADF